MEPIIISESPEQLGGVEDDDDLTVVMTEEEIEAVQCYGEELAACSA